MKTIVYACLGVGALALAAGCSASRAANKSGVEVKKVAKCDTVTCFLSMPTATQIDRQPLDDEYAKYRFRFQRRQGSTLRAIGYGGAAFVTLGLSEVAFTPVEGAIQNDKQFLADAVCHMRTEKCEAVAIHMPGKEVAIIRGEPEDFGYEPGDLDG